MPMFYDNANIPTVQHHKMCEKIEDYHKSMVELMELPLVARETGRSRERIQNFKAGLEKTFNFWTS